MLLQTNENKYSFSRMAERMERTFQTHAPGETTVEATLKNGKVTDLKVLPESRKKDMF
jgi:hypothetical protein